MIAVSLAVAGISLVAEGRVVVARCSRRRCSSLSLPKVES